MNKNGSDNKPQLSLIIFFCAGAVCLCSGARDARGMENPLYTSSKLSRPPSEEEIKTLEEERKEDIEVPGYTRSRRGVVTRYGEDFFHTPR